MAEMTIHLEIDPVTNKKNIIVKLESDADALPHEHEHMHRQLVEKLIGQGILDAAEVGELVIERATPVAAPASTNETPTVQRQAQEASS